MLGAGDTVGIFQLESSGMRDVLRKMHPDCIEDIIAIVALYRPGPMDNIPRFIACKKGEEEPDYLHPMIEPILKETYGIIVYQEQVMQIAQVLSGYSLGEADLLRRAMGKKIKKEMDEQKERFVSGAVANGVDRERADYIFELVAKFAGYGFNKSHAACYAIVAYQTAYLKANFPVEFIAASMTLDLGNSDKLQLFRREAMRLKVPIDPPAINASGVEFAVSDGVIKYSLAALKNVGRAAVEHVVATREAAGPFGSLGEFARRIDAKAVNKRALESLARAGAFDEINANRAQVTAGVEAILAMASRTSADTEQGQSSLFGSGGGTPAEDVPLPAVEAWPLMERLAAEFETVGFYLSGHPLDEYMPALKRMGVETWASFHDKAVNKGASAAKLAGTVIHRQERRSKSGNRFAFVGLSDPTGQYEAICFSDTLAQARDLLEPGNIGAGPLRGRCRRRGRAACGCSRWKSSMPRRRRWRAAGHRAGRCRPGGDHRREARQWRARAGAGGAARRGRAPDRDRARQPVHRDPATEEHIQGAAGRDVLVMWLDLCPLCLLKRRWVKVFWLLLLLECWCWASRRSVSPVSCSPSTSARPSPCCRPRSGGWRAGWTSWRERPSSLRRKPKPCLSRSLNL
jgi:DNA polymerase III subunit alpha